MTSSAYSFGDNEGQLGEYAWYNNNSGTGSDKETHPVGQKKPNAWELFDMHGNVCEWCQDWHADYPAGPVTDPWGPSSGSFRVNRGGYWFEDPRLCQSGCRQSSTPDHRYFGIGFRLVRTV